MRHSKERKPTERRKNAVALAAQVADGLGDIGVGPADEDGRSKSGGHGHSTAGADREDRGETHSE